MIESTSNRRHVLLQIDK
jgi:hypothetical protein